MATDAAGDRPRHDQRMGRPLRAGMVLSARGRERVVAEAEVAAGVCVLDEPAGPFADHDAYLRDAPVLPPSSGRSRFGAFWLTAWLLLAVGLWFGRSFVAGEPHVSSASATVAAARITQPIEQIEVGQRVVVDAPMAEQDYAFGDEVDSATWRRVTLRAPKRDGGWADVTLLRPAAWLAERGAAVGGTIEINVPECGIEGQAEVRAIDACPAIAGGKGRIVTGTFRHSSANIIDLHVEGLTEPIGTTANHSFWSIDRQTFVRADSLQPGERLRGAAGPHAVVRIVPRAAPEPVYNLEIQVDHVYHVGSAGLLVHNGTPIPNLCEEGLVAGKKWYHGTDVNSADDIINNGLDAKKLDAMDPIDGKANKGLYVTPHRGDAVDYARDRSGDRGLPQPGTVLEWDEADIGRFLVGPNRPVPGEAVIPYDVFDKIPRPRRVGE